MKPTDHNTWESYSRQYDIDYTLWQHNPQGIPPQKLTKEIWRWHKIREDMQSQLTDSGLVSFEEKLAFLGIDILNQTISEEALGALRKVILRKNHPDKGGDEEGFVKAKRVCKELEPYANPVHH